MKQVGSLIPHPSTLISTSNTEDSQPCLGLSFTPATAAFTPCPHLLLLAWRARVQTGLDFLRIPGPFPVALTFLPLPPRSVIVAVTLASECLRFCQSFCKNEYV